MWFPTVLSLVTHAMTRETCRLRNEWAASKSVTSSFYFYLVFSSHDMSCSFLSVPLHFDALFNFSSLVKILIVAFCQNVLFCPFSFTQFFLWLFVCHISFLLSIFQRESFIQFLTMTTTENCISFLENVLPHN